MPNQSVRLDRVFQALADPTRRGRDERAGATVQDGAAVFLGTPRRAGRLRPGPVAQGRTCTHLSARAAGAEGCGALDGHAARELGTPPRSPGQLPQGPEGAETMTARQFINRTPGLTSYWNASSMSRESSSGWRGRLPSTLRNGSRPRHGQRSIAK